MGYIKMSIIDGYDLVKKADKLVTTHQFKDASIVYNEASEFFQLQIGKTSNKEINSALEILVDTYKQRSLELSNLNNVKKSLQIQRPSSNGGGNNNNISTSLANARGKQGSLEIENDLDPFKKFSLQMYNLLKLPKLKVNINRDDNEKDSTDIKVKLSGKSVEELEYEVQSLKQILINCNENLQIYENFYQNLSKNFNNHLNNLQFEINQQNLQKIKDYDSNVEKLTKENNQMIQQIKKLKQRWDELVESAKRRRSIDENS
ncbi:hypothetical protein WICMUC_000083 [Wickerhamomyces mucosus]|uniref:Uncharacterized protein n=1 Tax=Wickerhamomyces mucosus TaxID=1378264 RepID=A0A9P8Q0J0_9ASCO|nr:hypothetical protein WICMUC_000083 [Wickerhamomyces mucosus]